MHARSQRAGGLLLVAVAACGPGGSESDAGAESESWAVETAQVVFTGRREGVSDIYVLDRATGAVERVTQLGTPEGGANRARPSPDGMNLAFQVRRGTDYEIHVMELSGGSSRNVSRHPEYDVSVAWSPDGARVAFMSTRGFELGSIGSFPGHIYVASVTGDDVQQVTREPMTSSFGPSDWSADGRSILMARDYDGRPSVVALDVGTGEERRITAGSAAEYSAVFSHAGDRIAFHSESDAGSQIVIADLDGGNRTVATAGPGYRYYPHWSPDDRWLIYTASDEGEQYDIRAVRLSDGHVLEIVATPEDEREGEWLPH